MTDLRSDLRKDLAQVDVFYCGSQYFDFHSCIEELRVERPIGHSERDSGTLKSRGMRIFVS
jgi:hypothetical protein